MGKGWGGVGVEEWVGGKRVGEELTSRSQKGLSVAGDCEAVV